MARFSDHAYDEKACMHDDTGVKLSAYTPCQFLNFAGCRCLEQAIAQRPIHQNESHKGGAQWVLVNLCREHYKVFK